MAHVAISGQCYYDPDNDFADKTVQQYKKAYETMKQDMEKALAQISQNSGKVVQWQYALGVNWEEVRKLNSSSRVLIGGKKGCGKKFLRMSLKAVSSKERGGQLIIQQRRKF